MEMLRALQSRENGFSPLLQRESFHSGEGPVNGEEKGDKAAWERSRPADHAMRMPTLEFSKHLPAPIGNNMIYTLENDELFGLGAMEQFCLTALAVLYVSAAS